MSSSVASDKEIITADLLERLVQEEWPSTLECPCPLLPLAFSPPFWPSYADLDLFFSQEITYSTLIYSDPGSTKSTSPIQTTISSVFVMASTSTPTA
jgi:hypothetical protein